MIYPIKHFAKNLEACKERLSVILKDYAPKMYLMQTILVCFIVHCQRYMKNDEWKVCCEKNLHIKEL